MGLSLTSRDAARLRVLSDTLLSPMRFADRAAWCLESLRHLEALFQADRSLFILPHPERILVVSESVPDGMLGQFESAFVRTEPGRLASDRADVDAVLETRKKTGMDVFTNRSLLSAAAGSPEMVPWYHDVIVPSGVLHGSGIALSLAEGDAWLCVAHSRPSRDPFGVDAGLELLGVVLPSFRAGVDAALGDVRHETAREGIESLSGPLSAFDPDGREVIRSRALRDLLTTDPDSASLMGEIRRLALELVRFRAGPSKTAASGPLPSSTGTASTVRGRYELHLSIIPPGLFSRDEVVVVRVAPPPPTLPSRASLRRRYGLTRREAEVALLLAAGSSNVRIASELGISRHTVRTHAERIFRKLGIRSRKALGLRLLGVAREHEAGRVDL